MTGIIETKRLILRRFRQEDMEDVFAFLSDAETMQFEPAGRPLTWEEAKGELSFRLGTEEMLAVEMKESRRVIGNVYMGKRPFEAAEMGYILHRAYWGQGYAQEACRAAMAQTFAAGVHRIYAECDPENIRSWKLLERLGFNREGHLRQNVYFHTDGDGKPIWKDTFVYGKLKE